jgi:hypothetical protein
MPLGKNDGLPLNQRTEGVGRVPYLKLSNLIKLQNSKTNVNR